VSLDPQSTAICSSALVMPAVPAQYCCAAAERRREAVAPSHSRMTPSCPICMYLRPRFPTQKVPRRSITSLHFISPKKKKASSSPQNRHPIPFPSACLSSSLKPPETCALLHHSVSPPSLKPAITLRRALRAPTLPLPIIASQLAG
jgi:hypothetical protein